MKKSFLLFVSVALFAFSSMAAEDVQLSKGSVEGTSIYIGGEEIWPFIDGENHPYQDDEDGDNDVIWDVNDEKVKQVIRNCMKEASDLLASWVTNPHDPVHKALVVADKYNLVTRFFLWTNDYTEGESWQNSGYRPASSWNWQDSWLKFESTVNYQNSQGNEVCHLPNKKQTFDMINKEAEKKATEADRLAEFENEKPEWNAHPQDPGEERLELN